MKAVRRHLAILVVCLFLAPGCTPGTDDGNLIDDIITGGQGGQLNDGQQLDPILEATAGAAATDIGDFNNDGLMDLVSVSSENQPVQLHLLSAEGAFDLLSIAGGGPLAIMNDVVAVDLNNDGKLDVAVLVNDTGYVPPEDADKPASLILLIQGANPLNPSDWIQVQPDWDCYVDPEQPQCGLFYAANAAGPADLEVGDFNGDGLKDLAVAANNYAPEPDVPNTFIYVYLNPGVANVTNPDAWQRTIADFDVNDYTSLAVIDLDRDGDDDLVAAAPAAKTHNIRWLRNRTGGAIWDEIMVGQQTGGGDCIGVGDINEDGSPDVAVASTAHSLIQWFRNPGAAALAPGTAQVPWYVYNIGLVSEVPVNGQGQSVQFNQLHVLDTNGDGLSEVFATGSGVAYEFRRTENIFNPWTGTALFKADPAGTLGHCAFHNYGGTSMLDIIVPVDRDGLTQDGLYLFTR